MQFIGSLDIWGGGLYGMEPLWLFRAVTHLGGAPVLISFCLAVCMVLLSQQRKHDALYLVLSLLLIWLLNNALKQVFARARPDILQLVTEASYSFPSAHAMTAAGFWPVAAYVLFRNSSKRLYACALAVSVLLCVLVAISRVVLGVHYLSDVIIGLCLGFIGSAVAICFIKKRRMIWKESC